MSGSASGSPALVTRRLTGSSLFSALQGEAQGPAEEWCTALPSGGDEWTVRARHVLRRHEDAGWLARLGGAIDSGGGAYERLAAVAEARGFVVTTGQQPGLFGGPLYTLYKAVTADALARKLSAVTGLPAAPVFWAATDDSDHAEAAWTAVFDGSNARRISSRPVGPEGMPLRYATLGDVSQALSALRFGMGSSAMLSALASIERAYATGRSAGGAYVELLREIFGQLAIPVLDASHPDARAAMEPLLRAALANAEAADAALSVRNDAIHAAGFSPQVQHVPGLSLVFTEQDNIRRRIGIAEAAGSFPEGSLSPNVLLRPLAEASILPTVAYVGGAAELAYFAQVSAVAAALGLPVPLAVPRYSGTMVEPGIAGLLQRRGWSISSLSDPHAELGRAARNALPPETKEALQQMRSDIGGAIARIADAAVGPDALFENDKVITGASRDLERRVRRLERRLVAAVKRNDVALARDFAAARGALYPLGKLQERALGFAPLLARFGSSLLGAIVAAAGQHADSLVHEAATGKGLPGNAERSSVRL